MNRPRRGPRLLALFIVVLIAVLIVVFIAVAVVVATPREQATTDFQRTGNVQRDAPGLPPGVWHLVYEEPGAPALTAVLEFTNTSECLAGGVEIACDALISGARVEVEGVRDGSLVRVVSLRVEVNGTRVVQIFLLDEQRFVANQPPFVVPVQRLVSTPAVATGALAVLFAGPTDAEHAAGLRFVASSATGATVLRIEEGIAHVELLGGCDSMGSTFTVAQELIPTLTQFDTISFVKIYSPGGDTAEPDGPSNSIPGCLEP